MNFIDIESFFGLTFLLFKSIYFSLPQFLCYCVIWNCPHNRVVILKVDLCHPRYEKFYSIWDFHPHDDSFHSKYDLFHLQEIALSMTSLQTLDLSQNHIDEDGTEYLSTNITWTILQT